MSRPVCPCGHDRHHRRVQPVLRRGPWRWVAALLVGSAELPAREVRFVCRSCGFVVETTRDPAVLREYGRWPHVDRAELRAGSLRIDTEAGPAAPRAA